jgi:hypothetical protein
MSRVSTFDATGIALRHVGWLALNIPVRRALVWLI